ncbi:expressed unknown protein [Seminavis robusta]|uniref:MYND-type domain-containing protein n=1 Tax=Seminavis robusta TaxID=568900 RepID=A0A9N8EKP2_9STRA|nr:expressed unknown protein [Seminavis robusta]|eukprot:Sro1086_g239710.1 n/a (577) ;mRNA; f:12522-14252
MASTVTRQEGIQSLIDFYQQTYNNKTNDKTKKTNELGAFYVNPAVSFVSSPENGVSVCATQAIPNGTVLLRIPQQERVSLTNIANANANHNQDAVSNTQELIMQVLKALRTQYNAVAGGSNHSVYPHGDILLAMVILHDLVDQKPYTQAWPSPEDFQNQYYPLWDPSNPNLQTLLKGTFTLHTLEGYWNSIRCAFDLIVLPVLLNKEEQQDIVHQFLPPAFQDENKTLQDNLWDAFLYASSLVRSRSHEGSTPEEPEIIPLVDLINGLPSFCLPYINVHIRNCQAGGIPCTQVVATHDIAPNQEFIISYGDIHASSCLIRYAYCPQRVVHHPLASLDVLMIRVSKTLAPRDSLRAKACRILQFPSTPEDIERDFMFHLGHDALGPYMRSPMFQGETEQLKSLRQFLMVCHLMNDEEVQLNIETGRLRGNSVTQEQIGNVHLALFDRLMTEFTSLDDDTTTTATISANKDDDPHIQTIHNVRICQRDTMARWRHAICRRYNIPSQHADPNATANPLLQPHTRAPQCLLETRGCRVCGRTIRLKACTKCKAVKYCGRVHQIEDWKRQHRQECRPALAD